MAHRDSFLEATPLPIRYNQRQRGNVPQRAVSHNRTLSFQLYYNTFFGPLLTLLLHFEGDLSKILPTFRFLDR